MQNEALFAWVDEIRAVTAPDDVVFCDGSEAEASALEAKMLADGTFIRLNEDAFPHSFLHRSDPHDVARTEQVTFICSEREEDAGPTNHWMSPLEAKRRVWPLFQGAMRGRTMYVVPYLMGPVHSPYSRVGVEITDSPYVVANMRLMTRMGDVALQHLGSAKDFVRGVHSLGDLRPDHRYICHFPASRTIWSIGSGYGGNALLGKKCHALRLASIQGKDEGWLAEHMLILALTDPSGQTTYIAAAFPSQCGKTNLAMLVPTLPGYQVETIGDDIAWMHVGPDGRLWAINPEAGIFGVAPGTSMRTNPNAMHALLHDAIFTNVALRKDRTPYWEGMGDEAPDECIDWKGEAHLRGSPEKAAHPNARFTVRAHQCPSVGAQIDEKSGVPISAILFGGRRARVAPLVFEADSFTHGVYLGATMVSETTAAATGVVGVPRHDPMAMLPFCGYNMADYFAHWLSVGERLTAPPRIFHTNWFRTGASGAMLWPGYGDNVRVLQWIVDRVRGTGSARATVLGAVPAEHAIDTGGLSLSEEAMEELLAVDPRAWRAEAEENRKFFEQFGSRLPEALWREHEALVMRIDRALSPARAAGPGGAVKVANGARTIAPMPASPKASASGRPQR